MIVKTFQAKNLYPNKQSFFLLYGENEGLKKEITDIIINDFRENVFKYDSGLGMVILLNSDSGLGMVIFNRNLRGLGARIQPRCFSVCLYS